MTLRGRSPTREARLPEPQANLGGGGIYFRRAFKSKRDPNAQLVEKDFFDKLTALFRTLKRSEKWLIARERTTLTVFFHTIFPSKPVGQPFFDSLPNALC